MPILVPVLTPPLWSEAVPVVAVVATGKVAEAPAPVVVLVIKKVEIAPLGIDVAELDIAELVVVLELESSVILKVSLTATGLVSPA